MMYQVFSIIFLFWDGIFMSLNDTFITNLNFDMKSLTFYFYENEISLYNYLVISFTIFTMLFVVIITYKFFKSLYRMVANLW